MSAAHATTPLGRPVLVDAGWRAALVVVAAVAVALEAPAWARLPLSAAAALAVATFLLRRSDRGVLDGVLVQVGGAVVALVLLGVVLNLLPFGLGPVGWALAVGALELAALAGLAARRAPASHAVRRRRIPVAGIAWGAAAAAVLAATVAYSAVSFGTTHVAPLAIAAEPAGDAVTVTVTAGDAVGPFDLRLVTADGRTTLATSIEVGPGDTYTTRVPMPSTRAVLQLVPTGSGAPVRQLILDDAAAGTR
ncbi:hypothetical protein [uncultured Amnibacterium sp.]|uniref:hypothetical protein n=1 Tax=uncultured Amnibacterium sp. TaxID=1631851 RepID=UPI0035CA5E6E